MDRKAFLIFILVLVCGEDITAQTPASPPTDDLKKQIATLTQQNTNLRIALRQAGSEKTQLQNITAGLQKTLLQRNDSIQGLQKTIGNLNSGLSDQIKEVKRLEQIIARQTADLKAAYQKISVLEYDKKSLIDDKIVRIYNFSASDVRKEFLQSLAKDGSGFQYDDALVDDEIQITRNFNDQAEAWWVFDKTLDTILELKIRIKPHLYDPQKCIVFGETRLLQKTRYSNKPFEEQRDQEKIKLYREKTFRLLEGKLQGTSDK
ncbi:hypothetical protein [Arsenicibacter rosenii]|uniref:Uncharacterized protein n=1 Tax=Arsenicibacter rosenii TaxID=1750698 RepID=A0A1S2VMQ7_9BACT|nr:hypothetical protein [Arsenicibacter rosenii]OIN60044.1 hypothetical protein BLX24_04115 [Arsenicibacter rosenii]